MAQKHKLQTLASLELKKTASPRAEDFYLTDLTPFRYLMKQNCANFQRLAYQ